MLEWCEWEFEATNVRCASQSAMMPQRAHAVTEDSESWEKVGVQKQQEKDVKVNARLSANVKGKTN